jgi:hypothetical protein
MSKLLFAIAMVCTVMAAGVTGIEHQSIQEDDPGWSCVDMGDHACGPGNSNNVPPGCYDEGGVMYAMWPCDGWR